MIIGAFMMFATYGFSQFEVKVNPISALFGTIPLGLEYVIIDNIGAEVTVGYRFGEGTSGLNSKVLFKYYVSPNKGGDKFYIAPYFNYTNYGGTDTDILSSVDYTYKYTAMGAGLALGYKWVTDMGLIIELGGGAGKNFSGGFEYEDPDNSFSTDVFPINFLARVSIGYRF